MHAPDPLDAPRRLVVPNDLERRTMTISVAIPIFMSIRRMTVSVEFVVFVVELPCGFVAHAASGAEIPAKRASRAHLHEGREIVVCDADGVGRASGDARAALDAPVGIDHGFFEIPKPNFSGSLVNIVHHVSDVETCH
jgi:hypothetical protein